MFLLSLSHHLCQLYAAHPNIPHLWPHPGRIPLVDPLLCVDPAWAWVKLCLYLYGDSLNWNVYTEISVFWQFREQKDFFFFFSFPFRNLVRSIHPTTCRSMFSEANVCALIAGSGEFFCELAGSVLYTTEKSRAVWKKMLCLSEGYELSVVIDKMWKTNGTGSGFRRWTRTEYRFDTQWCRKFEEPSVATKLKIIN